MTPPADLRVLLYELVPASGGVLPFALAAARVLPTVVLVPAFGLGLVPLPIRAALGLALSASVAAALRPVASAVAEPWALALARQALHGLPVALVACTALWAASVAGGLTDHAVFGRPRRGRAFETLFGILAAAVFLRTGGALGIAERLAAPDLVTLGPLVAATRDLATGLAVGTSLAVPLLVTGLVTDLAASLAARELPALGSPAVREPLRALVVLSAAALLFEGLFESLAELALRRP